MTIAVGVVMGLHAMYEIFIGKVPIDFNVILTYLPVSLLYIGSMMMGYWGLRYIELSISSPICNSSINSWRLTLLTASTNASLPKSLEVNPNFERINFAAS